MQLKLPIFSREFTLIASSLGVYEKDDFIHYLVNGLPAYSHHKEDSQSFRYITSNFISVGLCRKVDVQRCFHVSEDSIGRAYKKFKEVGAPGFFGKDARKGSAHKIVGEKRERIQRKLDKGLSVNSIAKEENVSEGAIRYQIKVKHLKKK